MTIPQADMEFRPVHGDEAELAAALSASLAGSADPRFEGWGVAPDGPTPAGCTVWGLFMRDCLIGAAWLAAPVNGVAVVRTMALPRKRWGMGLVHWMLEQLAPAAHQAGASRLVLTLPPGRDHMVEILEDAGFVGPDSRMDLYPAGMWTRDLSMERS